MTEAPVACNCCRKAKATLIVKDNGHRTYPVCAACKKNMHLPTVVRKLA